MNPVRHFCTLFDSTYLFKGVVMIRSLLRHCAEARVFVLCMDEQTQELLERLSLPGVVCIALHEIETPELLLAKADRGTGEYCWTLSSCLPWFVLQNHPAIDLITYLDADLFFYSSVQALFDEIGEASIAIIEHRFPPWLKDREVNGRFCVEWVSFRRSEQGMACLARWREQCIEWCYYRLEDGKMGDQKYLDEWPDRYPSCHILQHPGAGVAPWNYAQYCFGRDGSGGFTVDGSPLVFYHFHQFQLLDNGKFDRLSNFYTSVCKEPDALYKVYERELKELAAEMRALAPGFRNGFKPAWGVTKRRFVQRHVPMWVKDFVRRFLRY